MTTFWDRVARAKVGPTVHIPAPVDPPADEDEGVPGPLREESGGEGPEGASMIERRARPSSSSDPSTKRRAVKGRD